MNIQISPVWYHRSSAPSIPLPPNLSNHTQNITTATNSKTTSITNHSLLTPLLSTIPTYSSLHQSPPFTTNSLGLCLPCTVSPEEKLHPSPPTPLPPLIHLSTLHPQLPCLHLTVCPPFTTKYLASIARSCHGSTPTPLPPLHHLSTLYLQLPCLLCAIFPPLHRLYTLHHHLPCLHLSRGFHAGKIPSQRN